MTPEGRNRRIRYKIDELAGLLHPHDGHRRILAMIDAYLDESGIHDGAAICVIAGYFAGRGWWRRFEKRWRKTLDSFGFPMEKFHAKDLLKEGNRYYNPELVRALVGTTEEFSQKIHPVSIGIIVEDFQSFSADDRKFMTGATLMLKNQELKGTGSPNKAYYVAFQHCLKRVAGYAPRGGKAHFFFGLDRAHAGYAVDLFQKAKNDPDCSFQKQLGQITFPLARETPQLQAADLLVHLTYLYAVRMIENQTWGRVGPDELLRRAIAGTIAQEDHNYMDKNCLELTLTQGIVDWYTKFQQRAEGSGA